jgi:hypothetical protein
VLISVISSYTSNSKPHSPVANFVPHPSEPTRGTTEFIFGGFHGKDKGYSVLTLQRIWPHTQGLPKLVLRADGGYSSTSDLDEETYALLVANNEGKGDHFQQDEEHIGAEAAEHYESLMVQRELSTLMERAEQNQRHTLFQIKCVIKECSCHVIIHRRSFHWPQNQIRSIITFSGLTAAKT